MHGPLNASPVAWRRANCAAAEPAWNFTAPVVCGVALLGLAAVASLPWALALVLIVAPVLEEIVFRLGVQERLLASGVRPLFANLVTAAAFALAHGALRSWPTALWVMVPALALGLVYQRRRALLPCIAAHAGMNLFWVGALAAAPWTLRSLSFPE